MKMATAPKVKPTLDFLAKWIRRKVEEAKEHKREPNVFWVTDLVRCDMKRSLELLLPPEIVSLFYIKPQIIHGELVHAGTEAWFGVREEEVERQLGPYKVRGRPDVWLKDEGTVVEIKVVRPEAKVPMDHHVLQLRIYMWLTGAKFGRLLYITHEWIKEYTVEDPLTDEGVLGLIEDRRSPRYDWECDYCPYKSFCPLGGRK